MRYEHAGDCSLDPLYLLLCAEEDTSDADEYAASFDAAIKQHNLVVEREYEDMSDALDGYQMDADTDAQSGSVDTDVRLDELVDYLSKKGS